MFNRDRDKRNPHQEDQSGSQMLNRGGQLIGEFYFIFAFFINNNLIIDRLIRGLLNAGSTVAVK